MARRASKPRASAKRGSRASIGMGGRRARVRRTSQVRTHSATGGLGQFSSGHRGHGMPHGFVSKAQWRFFFANPKLRAKYAHKEAHKTPGGPKVRYRRLPARKGAPSARTAR